VWAEVDLDAIRANVRAIRAATGEVPLLAVVKADGYGHGAVRVAEAALAAGASHLGVALVEEGQQLRAAGIDAPVFVLSEPVPESAPAVVADRLTPVVYTHEGIDALAKAVTAAGAPTLEVHLKVDTGMHRVGCAPADAVELARDIIGRAELRLAGVCTHLAVADEPDNDYTDAQLVRFESVMNDLRANDLPVRTVHAANTAAALAAPKARYDLVRVGIGLYGVAPTPALAGRVRLRPAMSVKARVTHVKDVRAGTRVSYGLRYQTPLPTRIATVPIGYADGVPRELAQNGGEVLVHGRRCLIAGTITMDQLMVDVGDLPVQAGDEVVLLGRQGDEQIDAWEWAEKVGTIAYTVVCGIGPRVPRRYVGG
jgi:alanine racemase